MVEKNSFIGHVWYKYPADEGGERVGVNWYRKNDPIERRGSMNIRYKIKYSGGVATSIYSLEDLESKSLIESMYFLDNYSIEITSRDLGTGIYDKYGNEVFENDGVVLKSGKKGIVKWEAGGFYIDDTPLKNANIITIIKEV